MALIDTLKTALVDREQELITKFEQEHIIPREAAKNIYLHTDAALVITGIRRCGKSILAYLLAKNLSYAYVNFEDERLNITSLELNTVLEAIHSLKGDVEVYVFDEIQNVDGWERFIARLIPAKKVIITGSNARLLSKELATFLTGRHINLALFPFSFREFCQWKNYTFEHSTKDVAIAKSLLQEFLAKGGFPLTYKLGNIFLLEMYKDILERDIVQRYKIRHINVLKEIAKYMISNYSKQFSYNQLRKIFGVKSVHTIKNYISYMQSTYLLFTVERFSFKLKEQALTPKKAYVIDTGLIHAVGFQNTEQKGFLYENVVAVELWRRGKEFYYWKDHQQREVDFVLKNGKKIAELVQVCFDISHIQTKERELKSLLTAAQELRCNELLVITEDVEKEEMYGSQKIMFIPLWKWLLKDFTQ